MNQNGFASDEEEAYCLEQHRLKEKELQSQDDHYQEQLYCLQEIAVELGIEHSISYLQSLKG